MKNVLEYNARVDTIFYHLCTGYEKGDFSGLFPYLQEDCRLISQWVLRPLEGYDALVEYFTRKGEAMIRTRNFAYCSLVELIGSAHPTVYSHAECHGSSADAGQVDIPHAPGKYCPLIGQQVGEETVDVLIDLKLDDDGMVEQISLCDPILFHFEYVYQQYAFALYKKGIDTDEDHTACVSQEFFSEIWLFSWMAGIEFEPEDFAITTPERWCRVLDHWKAFISFKDRDEAFRYIDTEMEMNYEIRSYEQDSLVQFVTSERETVWEKREAHREALDMLLAWTDRYRKDNDTMIIEAG